MAGPVGPQVRASALTVLWAAKGGAGTSTVAASLALAAPGHTVLIDLDGDLPAVLGIPEPDGDGIGDWLQHTAPADTLDDLTVPVDATTRLLPRGHTETDPLNPRWADVVAWAARQTNVIVDAGTHPPPPQLHAAGRSVLVTRACYLALRDAIAAPDRPDAVIVINEPGRALQPADVERTVGAPIIAHVDIDPAIARAIDAGLLATRLPTLIERQLRPAITARSTPSPSAVEVATGETRHPQALKTVTSVERSEHGPRPVTVDVHVGAGLPGYQVHGIPDAHQRESRDRTRAAIINSGHTWPDQRITINITPAGPVVDPHLDLAIAAGILAASGQLDPNALDQFAYVGELSLDGTVRDTASTPEPNTISDLTGRPPAPTRHLADFAHHATAATGHEVAPAAAPEGVPASASTVGDEPAHRIVAHWQQTTPPIAAAPSPQHLGGLA